MTRVDTAVMDAYYRDEGRGKREELRPVVDVIERAAPGVVELAAAGDTPGFRVRLTERPFPERYAHELRQAVGVALRDWSPEPSQPPPVRPEPGLLHRVVAVIRRLFSA